MRRARAITAAVLGAAIALSLTIVGPGLARAATTGPPGIGASTTVSGVSAFSGIACGSATTCEALGSTLSGATVTVAISGGVAAKPVTVPGVSSSDELTLDAIACPTTTTCQAVGSLIDEDGNQSAVVVSIANGVPSAPKAAADSEAADGDDPALTAVACPSATTCDAVGEGDDAIATQISSGSPSALTHDLDPEIAELQGIVCTRTSCTALGTGSDGNGILVPVVSGAALGATDDLTAGTIESLTAGACGPSGQCELLGTDENGNSLVVSDSSGTLGTPQGVGTDQLTSIACESASACLATGADESGNGVLIPIAGANPGTAIPAAPFGAESEIACGAPTSCLVAGTTESGDGSITQLSSGTSSGSGPGSGPNSVELNVGAAHVHGTSAVLSLACELACRGEITGTASTGSGRHVRTVTVARQSFSLPAASTRRVTVPLDAAGRQLLRNRPQVDVQLVVRSKSTVTPGHSDVVAIRSVTFGHPPRPVKRHRQ